jgi:hypothetical protein
MEEEVAARLAEREAQWHAERTELEAQRRTAEARALALTIESRVKAVAAREAATERAEMLLSALEGESEGGNCTQITMSENSAGSGDIEGGGGDGDKREARVYKRMDTAGSGIQTPPDSEDDEDEDEDGGGSKEAK